MAYSEGNVQVEFTENHEAGFKKGEKKWLSARDAKHLIDNNLAKETGAEAPKKPTKKDEK